MYKKIIENSERKKPLYLVWQALACGQNVKKPIVLPSITQFVGYSEQFIHEIGIPYIHESTFRVGTKTDGSPNWVVSPTNSDLTFGLSVVYNND